jgi:hypothetical protein
MESKQENAYILQDCLIALDTSSHCNVATFRISSRHLFPREDVRKMEQVLDFRFIDSETRKIYM